MVTDATVAGKRCGACGNFLPREAFSIRRNRRGGEGLQSKCKLCMAEAKDTKRREYVPPQRLTMVQAAYLAGLVDGEGCIQLQKIVTGNNKCGYSYQARMIVGVTDPALVEIARESEVGNVHFRKAKRAGWKPTYLWQCGANACRALLPQLLPYLRIKRRQAELVLSYLNMARRITQKDPERLREYLEAVDAMHHEIRALNKRGA